MIEGQGRRFPQDPEDLPLNRTLAIHREVLRLYEAQTSNAEYISSRVGDILDEMKFDPLTHLLALTIEPNDERGYVKIHAQIRPHHKEL